jgi:hypothetical protein
LSSLQSAENRRSFGLSLANGWRVNASRSWR